MSGHTPGPWKVWESDGGERLVDADDDDSRIAILRGSDADGRLIAAAPELLAALNDLMDLYGIGQLVIEGEPADGFDPVVDAAFKAIAKAEGRAE